MGNWKFWRSPNQDYRGEARKAYNARAYDRAKPHLLALLEADAEDAWALDVLGRLLMNTNQHEAAIEIWERLIAIEPTRTELQLRLAKCHRVKGEFERALELYLSYFSSALVDDADWEELDRFFSALEDPEMKRQACRALRDGGVNHPLIHVIEFEVTLRLGDSSGATERLKENWQGPSDLEATVALLAPKWEARLADVLLNEGLSSDALAIAQLLPEGDESRLKIEIDTYRIVGDYEAATALIEANRLTETSHHGTLHSMIRLKWAMGQMEEVIASCQRLLTLKPGNASAQQFEIRALVKLGDLPRLRSRLAEILSESPSVIEAHRAVLNLAFSEDEDWVVAAEHARAILRENPSDRRAFCHLALSLARQGDFEGAFTTLGDGRSHHPEHHEFEFVEAELCRSSGEGSGQIAAVNRVFSRNGYAPIQSMDAEHRLNIQYLACDLQEARPTAAEAPKVSIIMTMYGIDELLDVAIDSILNQSHANLELIVVDDCSPDPAAFEHVKSRSRSEDRLVALQTPLNGGTYLAKNMGLKAASGDFIGFMDSDDWCHPQRIERQLHRFEEDEQLMGTCDAYVRIDEESQIPYRGNGASRMACISLLMRREVLARNGYFDGLRVGADTEYIERIRASFGDDAFRFENVPTMLMTQHATSLTGGGRFHISWRSITGARLEHHSAFRAWHQKIRHSSASPYVPHPLRVRPFQAPVEMLTGPWQWRDETKRFSERIHHRNHHWWKEKAEVWQKRLSPKMRGRQYAEGIGVMLPELYWSGKERSEIPLLSTLPKRVVIKPSVGWSANNVFCIEGGINLLDDKAWTDAEIQTALAEDSFLKNQKPTYMVEELLTPEVGREDDQIPADYKFYCYGETIALVHVVLRKSSVEKGRNVHHYLDEHFMPIKRKVITTRPVPDEPFPMPDCWDQMIEDVRKIGKSLGCFMRIDMFATDKGPVFGEFTPTPEGGNGFTPWADKYLGSFWRGLEGADEGLIPPPPEWW